MSGIVCTADDAGLPIGWGLADVTGIWYMKKAVRQKKNG